MKGYIFNKAMDYRRGSCWNAGFDDTGLWVEDSSFGEPGIFISRLLDAGEKETVWHRLCLDTDIGANMAVYVNVYGTDDLKRAEECQAVLKEELSKEELSVEEERAFGPGEKETPVLCHRFLESACHRGEARITDCLKLELRNPSDLLLWEAKARYLWLVMILWGTVDGTPKVREIRAYFPKQSWISCLPEVYQTEENSFLERFLAVAGTLYGELEERIRQNYADMDIFSAGEEALVRLSGWLDMDLVHLWPPEHLRRYLARGAESYSRRGTGKGLVEMASAYTGERVYLREGDTEETAGFLSLYVPERAVSSQEAYRALLSIVNEGKPADTEIRIVVLRPRVRLDAHTYLGINSRLRSYQPAALDGVSQLGTVMAGGRK